MRAFHLIVLAVASILIAASPAAAAPVPGARYGGGQLPVSFQKGGDTAFAAAVVASDGQTVRMVATVSARCNRRPGAEQQQFAATGQVGADGRLRLQGATRNFFYATLDSSPRGRATVDLGFEGASATGTIRLTASFRSGGHRVRCDETIPLNLRAAGTDATAAAPAPKGATLFGTGDRSYRGAPVPIGLKVSADGRRVNPLLTGTPVVCAAFTDYLISSLPGRPVSGDGTFKFRERFTQRFRRGVRTTTVYRFAGRFTVQGAAGSYRAESTTRIPGRKSTRCSSGTVRFAAVR